MPRGIPIRDGLTRQQRDKMARDAARAARPPEVLEMQPETVIAGVRIPAAKQEPQHRPEWKPATRHVPSPQETVDEYVQRKLRRLALKRAADAIIRDQGLLTPTLTQSQLREIEEREAAERQKREDVAELAELLSDGFVGMLTRLGVTLSPAQRVLCLVCFDGVQPSALTESELPVFREIFGGIDHVPRELRRWITWVIGGRSGKSWLGAMALLWRALASDLSSLAPGEEATALIVSPELRLARHALRFVLGMINSRPVLQRMLRNPTTDSLRLERPDGYTVAFEALPASRGGGSVRARTLVAALLDEVAFFRDEDYAVNDRDIYQAVAPRVTIPGGFTLASSTPWSESGLLYEEYRANFGHPDTGIVAHASTGLMRSDNAIIQQEIGHARRKDPRNASREFDAQFGATDESAFFASDDTRACTSDKLTIELPENARPLVIVDAAFSQSSDDRFGWCVVTAQSDEYARRANGELHERRLVIVHEADSWAIDRGPREMAQRLRDEVCARYDQKRIIIDQYSDVAFAQLCADVGLIAEVVRWVGGDGEASKAERFRRVRTAMRARQLLLCAAPRLQQDMAACRSKLLPGGGESIGVPRTRRGHGDCLSSVVLGVSEAFVNPTRFAPAALTPEQQAEEQRRREFRSAQRRVTERRGHQWR